MSDTETRAAEARTENLPKTIDHALCARLVIREGKSFRESALQAGYSEAQADKGLRAVMSGSTLLTDAVNLEYRKLTVSIDQLKPLAVTRLYREIADPESSNGIKAIEVAGRFKETDWFVRNSETNLGIFTQIIEQTTISVDQHDKFKE